MKRLIIAFSCLAATCSCAFAQTGSSKPAATLNAEVFTFFPDQNAGQIIPFNTRQMLLDIIASPLAGNTITLGAVGVANGSIVLNGSTSGSGNLAVNSTGALSIGGQTGTGTFIDDGSNGTIMQFSGSSGTVANSWLFLPGTAGSPVKQIVQGTDTNITMQVQNKGAAPIQFFGNNSSWLGVTLGGANVGSGALTLNGNTSGNFVISSSLTGVPTMSTPWPVAAGGTGDTGTAWTSFTPSPSCGTATFTVNSARFKTIGKNAFTETDITISTIGTCAGVGVIVFNAPSITNSSSMLAGFNVTTSRYAPTPCFTTGGSSQFSCIQPAAAFAANDRLIVEGVYESQ